MSIHIIHKHRRVILKLRQFKFLTVVIIIGKRLIGLEKKCGCNCYFDILNIIMCAFGIRGYTQRSPHLRALTS